MGTDTKSEVEEVKTELEQLQSRVEALTEFSFDAEDRIEQLEEENKKLKRMLKQDIDVGGEGRLSPLERVLIFGWDETELDESKKINNRAVLVARNFDDISSKMFSDKFISFSDIQQFLNGIENQENQWIVAKRTANKIVELSNEKLYTTEAKGGKVLVLDSDEEWYTEEDDILKTE
jgi:hypothetical protein